MKADIRSIFYNNKSKKRCNVISRNATFWVDAISIPSAIFVMDATPDKVRIFPLERFDKEFSPEFIQ